VGHLAMGRFRGETSMWTYSLSAQAEPSPHLARAKVDAMRRSIGPRGDVVASNSQNAHDGSAISKADIHG
jgi:hypothetical protein